MSPVLMGGQVVPISGLQLSRLITWSAPSHLTQQVSEVDHDTNYTNNTIHDRIDHNNNDNNHLRISIPSIPLK